MCHFFISTLRSQRSELEQQLTESKLHCGNKQRELDAKHELIALAEQQLLQKDELIQQEMRRLEDAKLRKIKCVALPPPPSPNLAPTQRSLTRHSHHRCPGQSEPSPGELAHAVHGVRLLSRTPSVCAAHGVPPPLCSSTPFVCFPIFSEFALRPVLSDGEFACRQQRRAGPAAARFFRSCCGGSSGAVPERFV